MTAQSPSIVVRVARREDAEAVLALWERLYREHRRGAPEMIGDLVPVTATVDHLLNAFRGGDRALLVAAEGDSILGVIQATITQATEHPLLQARHYAVINDLFVHPEARHRGVGEALLTAAEAWAEEKGVHEFEAEIYEFNQEAAAFYHELGYEVVSRMVFKRA